MLLVLSVRLAATIQYYLRAYAPTNVLLRHLRTRDSLKWAIPVALVLAPAYLFAAAIASTVIADGGPGWLHLAVLLFIWNGIKFAWMGTLSPVLRIRVSRPSWQAGRALTSGGSNSSLMPHTWTRR